MQRFKNNFFEEFKAVVVRFPVPFACSALLTIGQLLSGTENIIKDLSLFLLFIPAFLASGAFTLWAENIPLKTLHRHAGACVVAIIFGFIGIFGPWLDLNISTFYLGLALVLLVAPFLFLEREENAIWLYCLGLCLRRSAGDCYRNGLWRRIIHHSHST